MKGKKLERVDLQVSIFIAVVILVSFTFIYINTYLLTYNDMIHSLNERANSIHNFLEKSLDKNTFYELNTKEDQEKDSYKEMKMLLEQTKEASGVLYLYTAKKNDDGKLIYLIDGLDSDSHDFRNVGDPLEREIWGEMELALTNETVMPTKIKSTDWGKIFVCYFPIHDGEKVIGTLGIEFDAEHQYMTFKRIKTTTPLIGLLVCIIAAFMALKLFRRISNPTYKDMYNTDKLTNVKNRNSFETDMQNLISKNRQLSTGIVVFDLNNLKIINDTQGHEVGDKYIKNAADVLKNVSTHEKNVIIYRVGGDEFVMLFNSLKIEPANLVKEIKDQIKLNNNENKSALSMAMGYASFDVNRDRDIYETYRRADKEMYRDKAKEKTERNR